MGFLNFFKSKQDPLAEALRQQERQRQEDLLQAHREVQAVWLEIAEKCKSLTELMKELRFEREVVEVIKTQVAEFIENKEPVTEEEAIRKIATILFAKDTTLSRFKPDRFAEWVKNIHKNVASNYPSKSFSVEQVANVLKQLLEE